MNSRLVNPYWMLEKARQTGKAIIQFNINNLEWARYILETANELNSNIILGVSETAIKYFGGYNTVYSCVNALISDLNINVDVCLHLDHGSSFLSCKHAIDSGFTSVMIDASKFDIDKNISITKEVVEYARPRKVFVEGEIGVLYTSDGIGNMTACDECIRYVKETLVDAVAPSIGNKHGIYGDIPKLNLNLVKELKDNIDSILVLHGGSGLKIEELKKCIKAGITKININTDLQIAWSNAVRDYLKINKDIYDPRKIISSGEEAIKNVVRNKIKEINYIGN